MRHAPVARDPGRAYGTKAPSPSLPDHPPDPHPRQNMNGDDLKGVTAKSLGMRKVKQTVKRSTRRRKEKGILMVGPHP